MSNTAAPPSGNGGNLGNASDNANGEEITVKVSDMERMLNDMLNKALGPRLKRETKGLEASMEKILQAKLASLVQPQAEAAVSHQQASADEPDKLNLKTLDARFKAMQDKIDAAERKAQEAEARATQTRVNSEVQSIFAKHAGQDNPHLPLYVEKYASQFRTHEGKVYRVAKDEFGEESLVPLEQAASDMFAGELKHLIPSSQPSRGGLPTTSVVRGMPIANTPGQRQGGIFEAEIMHHQAMSDPSLYASLYGPKK
jgi:hypothetical protein